MTLGFEQQDKKHTKDQLMRERMLEAVKNEKNAFKKVLDEFYSKTQRDDTSYYEANLKVIETIDHILAAGDWEDSLFLRNTVRPLRELRAQAVALKEQLEAEQQVKEGQKSALQPGQRLVYISVYQAGSGQLIQWEMLLRSLPRYVQGRPIYASEEDIQKALRARQNSVSEAYVVVMVNDADILDQTKKPRIDRLGLPILDLKENAIKIENIIEFVYLNQHYAFRNGKLILRTE